VEDGFIAGGNGDLIELFRADVDAAVGLISRHPTLRPELYPNARHEVTRKFTYHLWFRVFPEIELAEVFAVLHERRGPDVLSTRL
jgi:hypothetical protein